MVENNEKKTLLMPFPTNVDLPFFTYGIYKPGQLAFFQLKEFVIAYEEAEVNGILLIQDGLPILKPYEHQIAPVVPGYLLNFKSEFSDKAYNSIRELESKNYYKWEERDIKTKDGRRRANVLIGRNPDNGTEKSEDSSWDGWSDPFFKQALKVVEETLITIKKSKDYKKRRETKLEFESTLKSLFQFQMAYLLLWSSIERYLSLRYGLSPSINQKNKKLSEEKPFKDSLLKYVKNYEKRELFRADNPCEGLKFSKENSKKAIDYYYQIRSNIAHRGKAAMADLDLIEISLGELLPIFRDVLRVAEDDAKKT